MKNKFKILYLAVLTMVVASCSDAYDLEQDENNDNVELVYTNANQLEKGVTGLYYKIPAELEVGYTSILTDEVAVGNSNGGQGITDLGLSFNLLSGTPEAISIWQSYYSLIRDANEMLEVSEKLLTKTDDQTELTKLGNLRFELYTLRAFANLKLFMYFTPDYTNPNGVSIMKLDVVPPKDFSLHLPRETVNTIKEFILSDIEKAKASVSSRVENKIRMSFGAADAIKVKLASCVQDYTLLQSAFTDLTSSSTYRMVYAAEYRKLFAENPNWLGDQEEVTGDYNYGTSENELIFYLRRQIAQGGAIASNWYSVQVLRIGSPFFEMGRSLYNELDKLDASKQGTAAGIRLDERYNVNLLVHPDGNPSLEGSYGTRVATNYQSLSAAQYKSQDLLLISKYKGKSGARLQNNVPILRFTDMLLSLAEMRAAQGSLVSSSTDPDDLIGNYESVQSIIYNVRYYRWTPNTPQNSNPAGMTMPTITSQQDAYAAILNERRLEFAFEGQRYLDMKRIGKKANSSGFTRDPKDVELGGAANLPVSDYRMTFPIPNTEIQSNTNMTQNPGY